MQASRVISEATSSFHSHSNSSKMAEIAARIVEEFRAENERDDEFYVNNENDEEQGGEDEDDDEEFEFSFVKQSEFSPISADEIFDNGQIRPIYPIFGKDFNKTKPNSISEEGSRTPPVSIRLPLRKLFMEEEREGNNNNNNTSSCSSSEADDLEAIPPGTYCVWRPKQAEQEEAAGGCKKSKSTGSSKRWRFRDLIHRSNSDGKDTFVFLTPTFKKKEEKSEKPKTDASKVTGKVKVPVAGEGNPAVHYSKSGSEKRKTYLPYRQDLVGFFANMNGMSRNVHPF